MSDDSLKTIGTPLPLSGSSPGSTPGATPSATPAGTQGPTPATTAAPSGVPQFEMPTQISRFRIERLLGAGGFGAVYLAQDEQLERLVAIKVPHTRNVSSSTDRALCLQEARTVASLEHPHIVPVLEIGSTGDVPIYIVSRFIVGQDLATLLKQIKAGSSSARAPRQLIDQSLIVRWIIDIADALGMAHQRGIVHRDIKPNNILVDNNNQVYLVDFGLAVRDGIGGHTGGTPAYMSPEQLRGESHRVDGRSDLFSLGVLFYELLCGQRPFYGQSRLQLFEQIAQKDPEPLREQNDAVPVELERICMKLLAKRKSERYANAQALIDDLNAYLELSMAPRAPGQVLSDRRESVARHGGAASASTDVTPGTHSNYLRIVPKSLRSFDQRDSDFFLDLLPGPRNRFGLPESIAFWKSRIEENVPDQTFLVGLVYGPSGCGKSSMMKAGLLPRLDNRITPVYIEATADDTERALMTALRKQLISAGLQITQLLSDSEGETSAEAKVSEIDETSSLSLVSLLASVRRGSWLPTGQKLLIVIDQFEQWLNSHSGYGHELLDALAQCDGVRVQAIVMVRDDFWMAATRFFQSLDIPLLERVNSAAVDLFDLEHAQRVLKAFGRAYGKLESRDENERYERKQFVRLAVESLAENHKVISIRLALFAELMKGRNWVPQTLKELGGTIGIGAAFLEETFSAAGAPPEHRYHQDAARQVLNALLPEPGSQIKGHMRSRAELLGVSGYSDRPADFANLIRLLDRDLRLITPVDLENIGQAMDDALPTDDSASRKIHYQLTHDYLIPSLREWLTRKQSETHKGRTELRLAERANAWHARPENKQLPTFWEWIAIRWFTQPQSWSAAERRMMRATDRLHALFITLALLCLACIGLIGWRAERVIAKRQAKFEQQQQTEKNLFEARQLVNSLLTSSSDQVPRILAKLQHVIDFAQDDLNSAIKREPFKSNARLYATLGKVVYVHPSIVEPELIDYLKKRLLDVSPEQFSLVCSALAAFGDSLSSDLWSIALDSAKPAQERFHAAAALADLQPFDSRWDGAIAAFVAARLVEVNPTQLQTWRDAFHNVANHLIDPLANIVGDRQQSEVARSMATNVLLDYAESDPQRLVQCIVQSDLRSFEILLPALQQHASEAAAALRLELENQSIASHLISSQSISSQSTDSISIASQASPNTYSSWPEASGDLIDRLKSAGGMLTSQFAFCQSLPQSQFDEVAQQLTRCGYRPVRLRPFAKNQERCVSVIWHRDGRPWLAEFDLPLDAPLADRLIEFARDRSRVGTVADAGDESDASKSNQLERLIIADVNVQPGESDQPPKLCALWESAIDEGERRQAIIDVDAVGWHDAVRRLRRDELQSQLSIAVRTDHEGIRRYTAVWSNVGAASELIFSTRYHDLLYRPVVDIAISPLIDLSFVDALRMQLRNLENGPDAQRPKAQTLEKKAALYFHLDELDKAEQVLQDISQLRDASTVAQSLPKLRALVRARTGEDVEASLEELAEKDIGEAQLASYRIMTSAWQKNWSVLEEYLEKSREKYEFRGPDLLAVARAVAQSARAASDVDADRAERYRQLALDLLERCAALRALENINLRQDPDFVSLFHEPRYHDLIKQIMPSGPMALLLSPEPDLESRWVWCDDTDATNQMQRMSEQGFRPAAITTGCWIMQLVPSQPESQSKAISQSTEETTEALRTAMLWQRKKITQPEREQVSNRRALAAIALLQLGKPEYATHVWSEMRKPDSAELHSYLVQFAIDYQLDAELLINRLSTEPDLAVQRTIMLILAKYVDRSMLNSQQLMTLRQLLWPLYETHPDSGLHAASRRLLESIEELETLRKFDTRLAAGESSEERHWFVTKTNLHTMVVIDPPDSFLMGSPLSEPGRSGGPVDNSEALHRRSIGRRFALSSCEVSVAQFLAFRSSHYAARGYARRGQAPVTLISWYDAAAYCNWLSDQEKIPRNEWCYEASQRIGEGLVLAPDYLQRRGYRLPTEAEWEFACRAGSEAARCYGESELFLGDYANFASNSSSRQSVACGRTLPNALGLFDMHGNVAEWCQDPHMPYDYRRGQQDDREFRWRLDNTVPHVLRGGSTSSSANAIRSAQRNLYFPSYRSSSNGFRIACTVAQ